jgi:hypothetical protein
MIDTALIREHYDRAQLLALADAFATIHAAGVLELQVKANSWRIAEGFQERNPEELTKEILQVQQTNRGLLALHEWAGNIKKEIQDA